MKKSIVLLLILLNTTLIHAQTFADIVEKVDQSVVKIEVIEKQNLGLGIPNNFASSEGLGSGVLVGEKNLYILTAAHVVDNATKIIVEFKDGTKLNAHNKRVDKTADVALIQLEKPVPHIPAARLGIRIKSGLVMIYLSLVRHVDWHTRYRKELLVANIPIIIKPTIIVQRSFSKPMLQ